MRRRHVHGFMQELTSLFPPRTIGISLFITLLAIPGAGYDLIAAWVVGRGDLAETEMTAATLGNLYRNCFAGMSRDQVLGVKMIYYLAMTVPVCILIGVYLTRSNLRWQWLLAQRLGGVWRWWRRKTAIVLSGVFLYRLFQLVVMLLLGSVFFRWEVYPLCWSQIAEIYAVQLMYLMFLCMLQTSIQVISGDARWSFGVIFFYLMSGLIIVAEPNNATPASYLPGLWGIWRQSIEGGDSLGFPIKIAMITEGLCIGVVYGLTGSFLKRRGLAQIRESS